MLVCVIVIRFVLFMCRGVSVCLRSVDCENFYNLFQMVGAMTHKNDNTINIIFKCINDKSEHEKIKANSNYVNS